MIDISICWGFDETPEESLPRLREMGFEGIELWPDPLNRFGAARWASALNASDLKLFQLCPYFNFMGGDATMARSRAIFAECMDAARATACKRLRVFTGPPWGEGVVGANEATDKQWRDAIAGLQEFCDQAAPEGIELCLECHTGSLMEDSPNALKLIDAVARPNLTVNLQIPFEGETWQYSVASLGKFTSHIHIHNWTQGFGEGDLTYMAEGAFDWTPVLRTLVDDYGRSLTLSLEHITHNNVHDAWETARRDGPYLCALRDAVLTLGDKL